MSYHIFQISAFRQFSHLDSFAAYREAKLRLRELRQAPDIEAGTTFRMMFAETPLQAERLLKEKREPRPMGEHD